MAKGQRPDDLKYSETHEWVRVDGKTAIIGITDYAIEQLGDITHIELPKVGQNVEAGSPFGEIDSVKTTAELYSPVSGKVTAVNHAVENDLDILASEPYDEGWLIKVKMKDPSELDGLMSAEEYTEMVEAAAQEEEEEEEETDEVDEDDFM
jgi:glycine cleavage system H protein